MHTAKTSSDTMHVKSKATLNKSFSQPANPHGAVGISENRVLIQRSLNATAKKLGLKISARLTLAALSLALLTECSYIPAPTDIPSRAARAADVVILALSLRNTSYRYGGKIPKGGIDCSGLVTYVFKKAIGLQLSGNAATLARQGREVTRDQMRSGDLVFFNTRGYSFSHVGIYIGNGEFIHAPNSRGVVRVDKLTHPYYAARFETARTLLD